uniref:Uncharacterized protein n=1 Tax=Fagus sylvatica TaxID=28930 RepID=A0A2N9ED85_FAGSY
MLATQLNDRVTSGRVHVGEFGFCVAFVLFNSDNHDVDVDDGDGERFPPVQDLRVPTTVTKGLCNGREQEREAEKLLEEREKVGLVTDGAVVIFDGSHGDVVVRWVVSRRMGFTGWWREWVTAVARWGGEEGRGGGEIEVVGEVVIGGSSRSEVAETFIVTVLVLLEGARNHFQRE